MMRTIKITDPVWLDTLFDDTRANLSNTNFMINPEELQGGRFACGTV